MSCRSPREGGWQRLAVQLQQQIRDELQQLDVAQPVCTDAPGSGPR